MMRSQRAPEGSRRNRSHVALLLKEAVPELCWWSEMVVVRKIKMHSPGPVSDAVRERFTRPADPAHETSFVPDTPRAPPGYHDGNYSYKRHCAARHLGPLRKL